MGPAHPGSGSRTSASRRAAPRKRRCRDPSALSANFDGGSGCGDGWATSRSSACAPSSPGANRGGKAPRRSPQLVFGNGVRFASCGQTGRVRATTSWAALSCPGLGAARGHTMRALNGLQFCAVCGFVGAGLRHARRGAASAHGAAGCNSGRTGLLSPRGAAGGASTPHCSN